MINCAFFGHMRISQIIVSIGLQLSVFSACSATIRCLA